MESTKSPQQKLASYLILLSFFGICAALVSLFSFTAQEYGLNSGPSFCNINATFNCDAVNASPFSKFLTIPLASYGLAYYLGILLFATFAKWKTYASSIFNQVNLFLSFSASLLSLVLLVVSKVSIGTFCLTCIAMYLINFLSFFIVFKANENFIASLSQGFKILFNWPLNAIFSKTEDKALLQFSFLVFLLVIFTAYNTKDFLLINILVKQQTQKEAGEISKQWENKPNQNIDLDLSQGTSRDYYLGDPNAKVKIIEFSDYECPACQGMFVVLEQILAKYSDKIFFVYKNFPLDISCNPAVGRKMHENACYAAELARCAGEQDKFWEMNHYLFSSGMSLQQQEDHQASDLKAEYELGVSRLGLDAQAIQECLNSKRHQTKISSDIAQGNQLDIQGTPSIWINGKKVDYLQPEAIEAIISKIIEK